jgi:hypothetical protein
VPAVAKEFDRDVQTAVYASAKRARLAKHDELACRQPADNEMHFNATLLSYGDAPGDRDVRFTFDLELVGENPRPTVRASLSIRPEDGERLVEHITGVHRSAWNRCSGDGPIDAKPDEQRPRWIDKALPCASFDARSSLNRLRIILTIASCIDFWRKLDRRSRK